MAEALPCDFDSWLKNTLVILNTDDEVFSPYIKGILEGDETTEEKLEALQGILTEITENGIDDLCQDILKKWNLREVDGHTDEPPVRVSDGEVTDSDQEELETSGGISTKNTNAEEVFKAEREKRERDKEEAQRKREKDKEDRAKQKSKDDERKEKEKKRTQKGERRR
ncbi:coiled-coil domain-containing protein 43 isoform X2 [Cherax quadricarinatus]